MSIKVDINDERGQRIIVDGWLGETVVFSRNSKNVDMIYIEITSKYGDMSNVNISQQDFKNLLEIIAVPEIAEILGLVKDNTP